MSYKRSVFFNAFISGALSGAGFLFLALSFAPAALAGGAKDAPAPAALSHVRVVRLSFIQGTASVRMAGSEQWIPAVANAPIQEGFSVATDKGSFVEVQFEDGSTVRLGEKSEIDFTQLALSALGGHINHLKLDDGYATLHVTPRRDDEYLMDVAGVNVTAKGKTVFRTDVDLNHMRVEVFEGHVQAADGSQTEMLSKNHALTRDTNAAATFQVAEKFQKDDWDKWTDAREEQSNLAYGEEAVNRASPIYGWDDLDVYGEWVFVAGYGNAWAPYEPLGWSPYSTGAWGFYPGMGYTWVSGEPWGWLPYHYGSWNFDVADGWFWMPGSFDAWSPELVNWYSGPGWIGWVPIGAAGAGGRLPCTLAVAGCLTAVAPSVVSTGTLLKAGSPLLVQPGAVASFTPIARPGFAPQMPATALAQPFVSARIAAQSESGGASGTASGFARGHGSAPNSVIMGRVVSPETFMGRQSTWAGGEPVRVQLGGTMGGRFATGTGGASKEIHGAAQAAGSPQILAHSSNGGFGPGGGFGSRGGSGGSGVARSGGPSGGGGTVHGVSAPAGGGAASGGVHH